MSFRSNTAGAAAALVFLCGVIVASCGGGQTTSGSHAPTAPSASSSLAAPVPEPAASGASSTAVGGGNDALGKALDEKRISENDYHLYRLLQQTQPGLLPAAYRPSQTTGEPSPAQLLYLKAHLSSYPADQRAVIQALTSEPGTPEFWNFPPGALRNFAANGSVQGCRAEYNAEKVGAGESVTRTVTAATTKYFSFMAVSLPNRSPSELSEKIKSTLQDRVPGPGGKGDMALGDYFDKAFEFYVTEPSGVRMLDPRGKLPAIKAKDGRIKVYIPVCKTPYDQAHGSPDGWIFGGFEMLLGHQKLRRAVLPHELFHVLEYTFWGYKTPPDSDWPYEAAAVTAEDLLAPDVRRWKGGLGGAPMDRATKCAEEPFHSSFNGECHFQKNHPALLYQGDYSKFLFMRYLVDNYVGKHTPHILSSFFDSFARAKGSAPGAFNDMSFWDSLPRFHLALVGTINGKPDPMQAYRPFLQPPQGTLDYNSYWPDRYTYRFRESFVSNRTKSWRFLSSDPIDQFGPNSIGKAKIEPGAAHRILIQIPEKVRGDNEILGAAVKTSDPDLKAAVFAVDGGPPFHPNTERLTQISGFGSILSNNRPFLPTLRKSSFENMMTPPAFILIMIVNTKNVAATYELAFTFPDRCREECGKHYDQQLRQSGCVTRWCTSPKDGKLSQQCVDEMNAKLKATLIGGGGLSPLAAGSFCSYACTGGLSSLSLQDSYGPTPDNRWNSMIAKGSKEPAGFVKLDDWPAMECGDIIHAGLVK